jgi:hypothetical protein
MKGKVDSAEWVPDRNGHHLRVRATKPERFWPWSGGHGLHLSAAEPQIGTIVAERIVRLVVRGVTEYTLS